MKERICLSCERVTDKMTKDHVVPRVVLRDVLGMIRYAKFCSSVRSINIQPLCSDCNSRKGNRVIDWRSQFHRDRLKSRLKQWGISDQIEFERVEEVSLYG